MKILKSLILCLLAIIFIFMIRPIYSNNQEYINTYRNYNEIENLIYSYRLNIMFNENLLNQMLISSSKNEQCDKLCFFVYYKILKSSVNHIPEERSKLLFNSVFCKIEKKKKELIVENKEKAIRKYEKIQKDISNLYANNNILIYKDCTNRS